MHGGFENETPNIPTNSIVKLDLMAIFKGNAILTAKLESIVGPGAARGGTGQGGSRSGSTSPSDGSNSRSQTPPLASLAK